MLPPRYRARSDLLFAHAIENVLILKADRLYARMLQDYARLSFPRATFTVVASMDAAALALAADPFDFLISGADRSLEGDAVALFSAGGAWTRRDRVLVATSQRDLRLLGALRTLGIAGVFDTLSETPERLVEALATIASGRSFWSATLRDSLQEDSPGNAVLRLLTSLEQLVLSVIGDGCDDAAAAAELGLRPSTVSGVRRDLHRKLGVQHRGELIRIAAQFGFVEFTPSGVTRPGFELLYDAYQARRDGRGPLPLESR